MCPAPCDSCQSPSVRQGNQEYWAFDGRRQLTTAVFNNGLEEIGAGAFRGYTSLVRVTIPPTVKAMKGMAFYECRGLATAILGNGLEEIGKWAFGWCTSLKCIMIPPPCQGNQGYGILRLRLLVVDDCDSQ